MSSEIILPNAAQFADLTEKIGAANDFLRSIAGDLTRIASHEGAYDQVTWKAVQSSVRAGTVGALVGPGDQLNVEVGGTVRGFDVLGLDEDVAVNPDLQHVLSIQAHDILYKMSFDPPMYLFAVTEAACQHYGWPSSGQNAGMPAGTYNLTLLHGDRDGGTNQDGTYQFATTQRIPIGGGIRHTTIGGPASGGRHTKESLLSGTFTSYAEDTVTTIETEIPTSEGSEGINLGTTTACDPQYKSGNFINFTQRQYAGCNRLSWSWLWQYLNSDDVVFQWQRKTIWSRNLESRPEGFLHAIDPYLRQVLGKVRKRVALSIADGGGYEDLEAFCFPASVTDLWGGINSGICEGSVDAHGDVVRSGAYTFWANTSAQDRVKLYNGEATNWLLASASCFGAFQAKMTSSSGATNTVANANTLCGVVPSLFVI